MSCEKGRRLKRMLLAFIFSLYPIDQSYNRLIIALNYAPPKRLMSNIFITIMYVTSHTLIIIVYLREYANEICKIVLQQPLLHVTYLLPHLKKKTVGQSKQEQIHRGISAVA